MNHMYQMFEILEVKIFESICAKAVHVEHYRIEMLDTGNVFPMVLEYVEDYQSKKQPTTCFYIDKNDNDDV